MNTNGVAPAGVLGISVGAAGVASQLPDSGPARVAGQAMLAATGGAFLLLTIIALGLVAVGLAMRYVGRTDA